MRMSTIGENRLIHHLIETIQTDNFNLYQFNFLDAF